MFYLYEKMISGTHVLIYTKDVEADKAFFRDVLKLPHVDAGNGRLIFALPPSELGIHDAPENDQHEIYLICESIDAFVVEIKARGINCSEIIDFGWGQVVRLSLPGGGKLGVYEPQHARPV